MTRRIEELLEPSLADFRASGSPPPRIEPSDWQTWQPSESAFLRSADGSGMGVWINLDAPPGDEATWVCPAGAEIGFRIGQYPKGMI